MFKKPTVLIVGAGASKEFDLPVGKTLAEIISRLLTFEFEFGRLKSGDHNFFGLTQRYFKNNPEEINIHLKAAAQIANGIRTVNSIDNYIDLHRKDNHITHCGKAAIFYSILNAEKSSILSRSFDHRGCFNLPALENTWLVELGRILVEGVPKSDIHKIFSNIEIVCFNYDRVIEEFFSQWLSAVYSISLDSSREIVKNLVISRPYGGAGDFLTLPFGTDPSRLDIWSQAAQIKTYTEQVTDHEIISKVHSSIAKAHTLIFLGFGFHEQNVALIAPSKKNVRKNIFATAYGYSPEDARQIGHEIHRRFQKKDNPETLRIDSDIYIKDSLTCYGLFDTFRRSINPK